ncbi:MAG: hypothetical protein ABUL60_04570 [Myxococcales bacterium]
MNILIRRTPRARARAWQRRSSWAAASLLLALATPRLGQAAAADFGDVATAVPVRVLLVAELGQEPTLSARIASWFEPSRFEVSVRAVERLEPARILAPVGAGNLEVWVAPRTGLGVRIYFATSGGAGRGPTFLVRDLPLPQGLDEMGAERLAEVLHLSAVALLEGRAQSERRDVEQGLREQSSPTSAPSAAAEPIPTAASKPSIRAPVLAPPRGVVAPAVQPRSRPMGRVRPIVGYAASARGDEGVAHGPRIGGYLAFGPTLAFHALAQLALPRSREYGAVTVRFDGFELALAPVLRRPFTTALLAEAWLGPMLDVVRFQPRSDSPTAAPGASGVDVRAGLDGGVAFVIEGSSLSLALSLHAAVLGPPSDYNLVADGVRHRLAASSPLVTGLAAELRF